MVGAGPSGLRTAARLAGAGLDVRVLEKKPRVGAGVVCTGIVGKEVFDDFGLDRGAVIDGAPPGPAGLAVRDRARLRAPAAVRLRRRPGEVRRRGWPRRPRRPGRRSSAMSASRTWPSARTASTSRSGTGTGRFPARAAAVAVLATGVDFGLQKKLGLSVAAGFPEGRPGRMRAPGRGHDDALLRPRRRAGRLRLVGARPARAGPGSAS